MSEVTIALAKGRMQNQTLELLSRSGIRCDEEALRSRRLSIEDTTGRIRFIFVKPADVPVYVEHGTADCGVCGADVLMESEADVLQPLDLNIACCTIAVAQPCARSDDAMKGKIDTVALRINEAGMLRVATKYPRIARKHFLEHGIPVEIIELSGSVELAPVLGLADCIVDLVETGRTLIENGLTITETIAASSGRFIVNRVSYHLKSGIIAELLDKLAASIVAADKSETESSHAENYK
ncbi:MAG: ATP phosphoribosyltransferase [Pyrinomonadaceae bacterium MAG19_C2-C3]|nr:ATP phosphoribosyltransferase [Pyrinomonadaceae bacterium MAG19_C2-C3]